MARPLTVVIVGFGNFGQFLAKAFVKCGHKVIGCSRSDYTDVARQLGCGYERDLNRVLDRHRVDVLLLATSILSTESVIQKLPVDRLGDCLVVDVLSVKTYARDLLLRYMPPQTDLLATHPMFGPESGKHSWHGLPFVYERVRVQRDPERCEAFIDIFRQQGCAMVEMSCADHDHYAASTQFITHTTGRMLAELDIRSTPINTKGFESLLAVVETTVRDSFELYYGLYKYNPNAHEELEKMQRALEKVKRKLEEYDARQSQG